MKYCLYIPAICLLLSCNNSSDSEKTKRTERVLNAASQLSTVATDSMCYILAEGKVGRKDTTIVRLAITGKTVTGTMVYMPYEKDSRRGTLSGIKTGRNIHAQWVYMQEGVVDSIAVSFHIGHDVLKQQQPATDQQTGREYYPANAAYNRHYLRIDCDNVTALINR